MILVALGTQDKQFTRLLDMIEEQIKKGNIKDKVIVQAGHTKFTSDKMQIFDLISIDEFEKLVLECDVLITHAGVGTILNGIRNGKKVIVVPRLKKYNEHVNDHQIQITNGFYELGYILKVDETNSLEDALKQLDSFIPKKFESNTNNFIKNLEKDINNLFKKVKHEK